MLSINNTTEGYLKNVEIKGNTIQDANNLANIKSVGDKIKGQEMYEIPLLSVGKNLFDVKNVEFNKLIDSGDGSIKTVTDNKWYLSHKIKVKNGDTYYLSSSKLQPFGVRYRFLDYKGNVISFHNPSVGGNKLITVPSGCSYFQMSYMNTEVDITTLQFEEGSVVTSFENYQENKLTILSPTQLEKVGDVADRIIERDGVWGVEKNVFTYILNGSEDYSHPPQANFIYKTDLPIEINSTKAIINSKGFPHGYLLTDDKFNGMYGIGSSSSNGDIRVQLSTDIIPGGDRQGFKEYLKSNNLLFKIVRKIPQFIPLPHDQQVKLRTFANRTNISFLCDVEGTIKADVPKSLGATVNTHTTQIDALNQELDRVKKLEESTVSTVVIESDFTVVEQTNQGYFEDVELNGRTEVNLSVLGKTVTLPRLGLKCYEFGRVVADSKYTISYEITRVDSGITGLRLDGIRQYLPQTVGKYTVLVDSASSMPSNTKLYWSGEANTSGDIKDFVILEGDHTQNPPPYFEGLASVGDGTDEIVALSINNGNLINYENFTNGKWLNPDNGDITDNSTRCVNENYIPRVSATLFFSQSQPLEQLVIHCYDINKKWIGAVGSGKILNTKMTLLHGTYYVRYAYAMTNDVLKTNSVKLGLSVNVVDIAKADEKKLLCFDPQDNTWKKPILDEFSTVKKGSDGVYRYYQGGLTRAYKVGDEANVNCITDMTNTVEKVQEKVYECTNIDLITYPGETNFMVKSGVLSPRTTLKVHSNISNVVSLLQKKVSLLESNMSKYMIAQNRLMLDSRYSADSVTFKVDYPSMANEKITELDYDLFNLLKANVLVGKDNYNYEKMINKIDFYQSIGMIDWDMWDEIWLIMEFQHNPPVEEIPEETPEI